jgi:NCAIR mutase (PurE)-related protein
MDPTRLATLLEGVRSGAIDVSRAMHELSTLPFADLGFARVDHHRALRQGVPEVVLGQGKSSAQIVAIARELVRAGQGVLITRLEPDAAADVLRDVPTLEYHPLARVARTLQPRNRPPQKGLVLVVSAGTSDLPVAEEALLTLETCGVEARALTDVGVAGLHRLLGEVPLLRAARAIIVVAGMEGALPSVVGGLVACPVVAVPTSVGYGVALAGMSALFGMLTSCASGITVVNIDNGFGAAMAVVRMLHAERSEAASP